MDKTFETLYKICMSMADTCLTDQSLKARFEKLEEEYQEVVEEITAFENMTPSRIHQRHPCYNAVDYQERTEALIKELADLLFVLLHIAHRLAPGYTAHDLLHLAGSKMMSRLNDPNYIAKEQRDV